MRIRDALARVEADKFASTAITFTTTVFLMYLFVYLYAIDFDKHFASPDGKPADLSKIMYFVAQCHTTAMSELIPTTALGRFLVSSHVFLSWGFVVVLALPSHVLTTILSGLQ